jgi:type II secretory pathway pseudopilin PulG
MKPRGFTLIEMILYIGLVAGFLVAITYFSIDATRSQARAYVIGEVNQNFRFCMDRIVRAIRQAEDISSISGSSLVLDNGADPDITISFVSASSTVTYQVGSGAIEDLNTDRVLATGYFSNRSTSTTKNVFINLRVDFNNPGTDINYSYTSIASTTVELRGY